MKMAEPAKARKKHLTFLPMNSATDLSLRRLRTIHSLPEKILEQYEAKPGEKSFEFAFTKDSAGAPIDSIMLNEDAKKIASAYDSIQEGDKSIGIGQDANLLAQEIGAEQFAMMMVDNPNYFNTIEPSLRQKLLEGSRKVLTLFGAVDGNTGNLLDVSISPILKRNKSIRNLYKNYTKQRDASIADKVDLADKGVAIKVRGRIGRSGGGAIVRQAISLKEAGAFRIDNKKVKNELTNILNRVDETPEGGMSSSETLEAEATGNRRKAIIGRSKRRIYVKIHGVRSICSSTILRVYPQPLAVKLPLSFR